MGTCYGVQKLPHKPLLNDEDESDNTERRTSLKESIKEVIISKDEAAVNEEHETLQVHNHHNNNHNHKERKKVSGDEKRNKRKERDGKESKIDCKDDEDSEKDRIRIKEKRDKKDKKHKKLPSIKPPEEYLLERLTLNIDIVNPPNPCKKCLVLDIDYTIFDHKSDFELALEYKRPYLHEFLKVCSVYYNIVIWSATAMCHIQTKMEKLHLLDDPDFKICFALSREFMFPYYFSRKRKAYVQDIKPLPIIWHKFGNVHTLENTIHIDDVEENFALNPQNGLKISPFKDALQSRQTDRELFYLTQYLILISRLPSFSLLDHSKWKDFLINKLWESQNVYSLPDFMTPPPPSTSLLAHHEYMLEIKAADKNRDANKNDTAVVIVG